MKRETWRQDLWMAANVYYALSQNRSVGIVVRTNRERQRLKSLFKNVPVTIKLVNSYTQGRKSELTIFTDEAQK